MLAGGAVQSCQLEPDLPQPATGDAHQRREQARILREAGGPEAKSKLRRTKERRDPKKAAKAAKASGGETPQRHAEIWHAPALRFKVPRSRTHATDTQNHSDNGCCLRLGRSQRASDELLTACDKHMHAEYPGIHRICVIVRPSMKLSCRNTRCMHFAAADTIKAPARGRSRGSPMIRLARRSDHRWRRNPFAVSATIGRNADLSRESIMRGLPGRFRDVAIDAYNPWHGTNPRRCQP